MCMYSLNVSLSHLSLDTLHELKRKTKQTINQPKPKVKLTINEMFLKVMRRKNE